MASAPLTQKFVDKAACPPGKAKVAFFDTNLTGFLLEVRASGGKTYFARYRNRRGTIRVTKVASATIVKLEEARKAARKVLAKASLGEDPAAEKAVLRAVPTLAQFVEERYLPFAGSYKRSVKCDESLLRLHILPRLGDKHLDQIKRHDIVLMHQSRLNEGAAPASANRLLILIKYIYNLAIKWEVPGVTSNPACRVSLFPVNNPKERFLTPEEAQRLLRELETSSNRLLRSIVAMLLLTGARKREVLHARWDDFDLPRRSWRIPLSKSGKSRHVVLSQSVIDLLQQLPKHDDCPWVFANPDTLKPFADIFFPWDKARKAAGLPDLRIHDLRHSFASFLVNAGRSLYEVQKLLGHSQISVTQRYAHLAPETLLDAADCASAAVRFNAEPFGAGNGK